jgi:flagellar hook-associated protein 1 FlgK
MASRVKTFSRPSVWAMQHGASNFNTSTATMALTVSDPTAAAGVELQISFTAGDAGSVTRHSDGKVFNFDGSALPPVTVASVFSAQGLGVTLSGAVNAGDQFVINSLQGAAADMQALQYSPTDLAAANPVNAAMGATMGVRSSWHH